MSKESANHHRQAAEHHQEAAKHHLAAAEHHEAGNHEKAGHHAHAYREGENECYDPQPEEDRDAELAYDAEYASPYAKT